MGIQLFFSSLLKNTDGITSAKLKSVSTKKLKNTTHIYFDFNSLIHNVSGQIARSINYQLKRHFLKDHNLTKEKINELIEYINTLYPSYSLEKIKNSNFENINDFVDGLNNVLDKIVIEHIILTLDEMIKYFFNVEKLVQVYICIDGIPSKAKMVEQKNRRFISRLVNVYESQTRKLMSKYEYQLPRVLFEKTKISPATQFMVDLEKRLTEFLGQFRNGVLSSFKEPGEAEFKIVNRVHNDNVGDNEICIFSPDADVILLTMMLNLNSKILRLDGNTKDIGSLSWDFHIIDVAFISEEIYKIVLSNVGGPSEIEATRQNIVNDIVFIYTLFGNDFVPASNILSPKRDMSLLIKLYSKCLASYKKPLLLHSGKKYKINNLFFIAIFKLLAHIEKSLEKLKRSYYDRNRELVYQDRNTSKEQHLIDVLEKTIGVLKSNLSNVRYNNFSIGNLLKNMGKTNMGFMFRELLAKKNTPENRKYYIDHGTSDNDLVRDYLVGLEWVMNYYFNGMEEYNEWFFRHHTLPSFGSIYTYLTGLTENSYNGKVHGIRDIFTIINNYKGIYQETQITDMNELVSELESYRTIQRDVDNRMTPMEMYMYVISDISQINYLAVSQDVKLKLMSLLDKINASFKKMTGHNYYFSEDELIELVRKLFNGDESVREQLICWEKYYFSGCASFSVGHNNKPNRQMFTDIVRYLVSLKEQYELYGITIENMAGGNRQKPTNSELLYLLAKHKELKEMYLSTGDKMYKTKYRKITSYLENNDVF